MDRVRRGLRLGRGLSPRLTHIDVPSEAGAWEGAGFVVVDGVVPLGPLLVRLRTTTRTGDPIGWGWAGLDPAGVADGALDGVPLSGAARSAPPPPAGPHPNGVTGVDHVVVTTPDVDRTLDRYALAGLELRRQRSSGTMLQSFYWAGDVILELVGTGGSHDDGPSAVWGLSLVAADLDATVALLGPDRISEPRDAVQAGRRIATFRRAALGLPLEVAVMSPHPSRSDG